MDHPDAAAVAILRSMGPEIARMLAQALALNVDLAQGFPLIPALNFDPGIE
jgi:hypothetical protein